MASPAKNAQKFARLLFKLSVVDGAVSADRVLGAIEYVEKHNIANPVMVLKAYHRLVETELAKSLAVVEHAGAIQEATLAAIASAMTRKYGRKRHGDLQAESGAPRRPARAGGRRHLRIIGQGPAGHPRLVRLTRTEPFQNPPP